MFDLSSRESWNSHGAWVHFLLSDCAINKTYLIGNYKEKSDCLIQEDEVQYYIAKKKREISITYNTVNAKVEGKVRQLLDNIIEENVNKVKFESKSIYNSFS